MNKTVKEMAHELDINPLRIYRFISKNDIKSIKVENGTNFFDENEQEKIKEHFNKEQYYQNDYRDNRFDNGGEIIDILKNEVEIKNEQIKLLQKSLSVQQKLLDQQQQLSLNDKKIISDKNQTIKRLNKSKLKRLFMFWK